MHVRFGKLSPSVLVCHMSYTTRLCTNTHFSCESGVRSSGSFDLSSQRQCPLVVVTGHDRLWRDNFSTCVRTSCQAIGALNLRWFSSSGCPCRDNPLIVSCSLACELSDPCGSFETFLTHSRHTSSNGFSFGQPHWNTSMKLVTPESRPSLSCSLAQAHAPVFFFICSRTISLARPEVFAVTTPYSTFCPLSLDGSVMAALATSAAVLVHGTRKDVQNH